MPKILLSWLGNKDRDASRGLGTELGPVAQAVASLTFDEVHLLTDFAREPVEAYLAWFRPRTTAKVEVHPVQLSGPTRHREIYVAATDVCDRVTAGRREQCQLTFHLSPGTPAMHAVWLLIAKGRYPAALIESSKEHGVETTTVPFEIAAELVPELLDNRLIDLSDAKAPSAAAFGDIIYRSREMARAVEQARRIASRSVPLLIEGESGTGKELLARATHNASGRRGKFVAVNCGAIPRELVESELFGHEAGAFTGAAKKRVGVFEAAAGGTLFLDEVGELPLDQQVKLLRVLQEKELTRVGGNEVVKVDARVIAATNRSLTHEVAQTRFREDLYYRLAVAIIRLPPLRERKGDVGLLVDQLTARVNAENDPEPGYKHKKLSPGARNLLLQHPWPGNVRELLNTLRRAALWTDDVSISGDEMRAALAPTSSTASSDILNRPLGGDLKLAELLEQVARHYLERAMVEASGVKKKAAKLVGLPSYQTLSNWLDKYDVHL